MHQRPARLLSCALSAALVLGLAVLPASAATGSQEIQVDYKSITVSLDGAPLTLADAKGNAVEPFAYQGTTYLPLRAVAGALGLGVAWDAASATVALTSGAPTTPVTPAAGETAYSPEKARLYINGLLKEWYFGAYDEQFLTDVGSTPERVQQIYNNSVAVEAEQFVSYLGIDYPADVSERLMDLWKRISAKVSYTVGPAAGPDADGVYSVQVTAKPLDIYKLLDEAWPAFSEEFEAKFDAVDTASMTDAQYHDWYMNEYDKVYRDGLCDLLESLIPKMGRLPEKTITVRVEPAANGYYGLNSDDNLTLSDLLIPVSY